MRGFAIISARGDFFFSFTQSRALARSLKEDLCKESPPPPSQPRSNPLLPIHPSHFLPLELTSRALHWPTVLLGLAKSLCQRQTTERTLNPHPAAAFNFASGSYRSLLLTPRVDRPHSKERIPSKLISSIEIIPSCHTAAL